MIGDKKYDLIILANHEPSKWAENTVNEYFGGKGYIRVDKWRVTNNYSLKEFKRKFKFTDLPCLHVKECVAKGKYQRTLYYGDDIEIQCEEWARREMRREARQIERSKAASVRLRLYNARKQTTDRQIPAAKRDVFPAPEGYEDNRRTMPDVCGRKTEGNR